MGAIDTRLQRLSTREQAKGDARAARWQRALQRRKQFCAVKHQFDAKCGCRHGQLGRRPARRLGRQHVSDRKSVV